MSRRLLNWRIFLALFFSVNLALAPAIAEARAGSSSGGSSSGMGSRGSRTYENNGAQPLSRSVTPLPATPRPPGLAPAMPSPAYGGGSFFQRHPFLTGLAGGVHVHFSMQIDGIQINPREWWDEHWIHDRIMSKL